MCQFTRTLHICGHSLYTLQKSCPYSYTPPHTSTPSCSLLPHPTRAPPNEFITRTTNFPTQTCGLDTCLYKVENDPFITPGTRITPFPQHTPPKSIFASSPPGVPSFSTPKSLSAKGKSLYDELQPYSVDLNFSDAVEAAAQSRDNFITTPKFGSIVVGRGCVRGTPKVVYHKYARLSGGLVRDSSPPEVVEPGVFYGKRGVEELVSEIEALEVIEVMEVERRRAQLTPMDMSA